MYKEYIELEPYDEVFELIPPDFGVYNIIFGQIYLDPATCAFIKNIKQTE